MPPSSTISSPCMRLNDDVLREIFIHCVFEYHDYNFSLTSQPLLLYKKRDTLNRRLSQLSVSQVCSSWRHVSLLTPQLWVNIDIRDWTETNIRIAREYLSRAVNLPISITLHRGEIAEESWQSQVIDFLSSYRILDATISNVDLILPYLPQRSVADLRTLAVFPEKDKKAQIDMNDIRYPKLDAIFSIHTISGSSSSLGIFEGSRLPMTVIEGWDLLSRYPSLEECYLKITQAGPNDIWPVSVPQIHLQHLRILGIDDVDDDDDGPFFFSNFVKALTLPVVEEIKATCDGLALPALQSLAHRSNYFPHLTNLQLTFFWTRSIVDAGALLPLTPSLKSISLVSYGESVTFDIPTLNGLASGSLAPQLQSLHLGRVSDVGLFLDMVESRMRNAQTSSNGVPAPLTNVRLFVYDRHYYDRVEDMRQRGIPIYALM